MPLARRPMICFAVAVTAGVLAARFHPALAACTLFGWILLLLLFAGWLLTPADGHGFPVFVPEPYREIIPARPGFLAKRGTGKFLLLVSSALFLIAVSRQAAWERSLSPSRLPAERWFNAALVADGPSRAYPGERGGWRIGATLFLVDGRGVDDIPVRVHCYGNADFRRGDIIHARVRKADPAVKPYPGAFDFALLLEREGAAGTLFATAEDLEIIPVDSPPLPTRVRRFVDAVRGRATALTLERGGTERGLLAAMLYGHRRDTPAEVRDAFRRVGIGHVLAISGLHVGLVVGLLWWLCGCFGLRRERRALLCIVLALFYLGLSGGQVAAARATLMAAIHLACVAAGRKADMMNSLGAAAFVIVLLNPSAPLDISFQLSFIAVVFIFIALRKPMREEHIFPPSWKRRLRREIISLAWLSVVTWIGLFPIIALVFNQVNLIGLPVNIVVIPLMSLVLAGGLLLPVAGIPFLAALLVLPSKALTWIGTASDAVPLSSFAVQSPPVFWVVSGYAVTVVFMLRSLLPKGAATATAALAALSCAGLVAGMASVPPPPASRIAVLPASGSGLGTMVVETPEGGIAVLGQIRRGGLNEADWLHSLRRGGGAALLAVGRPARNAFDPFAYHYPVDARTVLPRTKRDEPGIVTDWQPLPGADGVEYRYARDGEGVISSLSARAGDATATLTMNRNNNASRRAGGVRVFSGGGENVYDGVAWRIIM